MNQKATSERNDRGAVRVRFETHNIAPHGFPPFTYTGSVLGHSTIQYTALVATDSVDEAISAVRRHWEDAVFHAAEAGVYSFRDNDVSPRGYTYGTYLPLSKPKDPTRTWYQRLHDAVFSTSGGPDHSAPHNPLHPIVNR